MPHKAPILNVPKSIREDDTGQYDSHQQGQDDDDDDDESPDEDDDDDLIFGALEEEYALQEISDKTSPSADEGLQLHPDRDRTKKRERAHSSISTVDDDWDHILPITDGDGPFYGGHHLQSIHEKSSIEPIIGMSNFRVKHRLRRRSRTTTLDRWKDAVRKVVQLKDPWWVHVDQAKFKSTTHVVL